MRTGVSPKRIVTGSSVIKLRLSTPSMRRLTNSRQCPALPRARSLAIWLLLSSHRPGCKHPLRCSAKICRMDSLTTGQQCNPYFFLRKEVIQPHLPIRLPCYDFTPVTGSTFDSSLHKGWVTGFGHFRLPWCDGRCVQDPGTYSPRHADSRLLAIPASCSRVADYNPN